MPAQHYVSRFHLAHFCDPASLNTRDPWLWLGMIADGSIKRRSPKNVGTITDLFDGPGGFGQSEARIETFLANEVEGPAGKALLALSGPSHEVRHLPQELMRYLAWAASRSLPMQRLEVQWNIRFGSILDGRVVEPPPEGIREAVNRMRPVRLIHPALGERTVATNEDMASLFDVGWIPDPSERSNFLEGAHIQAYYFQVRWFPRLRWFTLRPPEGEFFIIGDRPIGWGVPDCLNAPPCCLRDPSAFLIAPLSRSLALVGRNNPEAWTVTTAQVNAILAAWSHEWIAGPTAMVVANALQDRQNIGGSI